MPLNRLSAIGKRNWPDLLLALALAASLPGCLLPDRTGNEITYYNIEPEPPKAPDRTPADLSLAVRAFDSASRYQERILIRGDGLPPLFELLFEPLPRVFQLRFLFV